jgi:hypothetical protein
MPLLAAEVKATLARIERQRKSGTAGPRGKRRTRVSLALNPGYDMR